MFDEAKLRNFNGHELRALPIDDLTARLEAFTGRAGLRDAAVIAREKIQTLADFWPLTGFLFDGPVDDPAAAARWLEPEESRTALAAARDALAALGEPFSAERVEVALRGVVERRQGKPQQVFQPVRVAISGTTISPGIFESVAALGREETLARIDAALARATVARS